MKTKPLPPQKPLQPGFARLVAAKFHFVALSKIFIAALAVAAWSEARAATNVFFNTSQTATVLSSNINAVTLRSGDYLFTHTVDGYWSAYVGGPPTGRFFSVFWPNGIQAQAITAGPSVGIGANIIIKRVDGKLFDLRAFTGKLLANTAGTGGAFEIMPLLDGEDALNDPLMFDCSGYGGQSFPHAPMLVGYDTYKIHLWVDWALTALTLIDTNSVLPPVINAPRLEIQLTQTNTALLTWPTNASGFVLQQNFNLTTTNWQNATNAIGITGTNNQVVRPRLEGNEFFRLKLP